MLSRLTLCFVLLAGILRPTAAPAQTRTGLCLQQISCSNGASTTITGTVYAPNGTDPIPRALVYIPNAPVAPFTPGVSCSNTGQQPSGSPLVGTSTAVDGTFTLANVPVGANTPARPPPPVEAGPASSPPPSPPFCSFANAAASPPRSPTSPSSSSPSRSPPAFSPAAATPASPSPPTTPKPAPTPTPSPPQTAP